MRVAAARTKLRWGVRGEGEPALEVSTEHLDGLLEHNAGDMTAVLEAGMPLHRAQQAFAAEGQMLALDPPDPGGARRSAASSPPPTRARCATATAPRATSCSACAWRSRTARSRRPAAR